MGSEQQNSSAETMHQRMLALREEGLESIRASRISMLEYLISQWPTGWGKDLQILIYGDFRSPERQLDFPSLGITIYPERIENSVVSHAMCVLKAIVDIKEKNVPSLIDAFKRINVLLGSWTLVTWGNSPIKWWSHLTHDTSGAILDQLDHQDLGSAIEGVLKLPDNVRRKVDAALYWIREPRNLLLDSPRTEILRLHSAYWNAFECLVYAVNMLHPSIETTKLEKQQRIDEYFAEHTDKPTAQDIEWCYRHIVNPGFRSPASHALQVCFDSNSDKYIEECFNLLPERDRLYNIRNAINHGEVDAENPEELIRIESRFSKLFLIVFGMFGRLIPFPAPVDRP